MGLCSGGDFATEEVDKYLPRNTCTLIKSALGFKLGKVCPYLEATDMGGANNACIRYLLCNMLKQDVCIPEIPQMAGALGAAILAAEG